jgi:hypothetical protein
VRTIAALNFLGGLGAEMRFGLVLTAALLFAHVALAQAPACRQPWMPADSPAFCAWQAEPSLPEARTYHAVTTSDKYIYVLGGFRFDAAAGQVIYYDSVVRTTIGTDGHLSAWAAEPSFNTARSGASATAVGGCLFLAGGSSSTPTSLKYYDDVQSARIDGNGRLSPWTTSPNHLKIPRSNLALAAVTTTEGVFLNVVGGVTQIGQDTVHLDTVEVAKVGSNCSVGEWNPASYHLKGGRSAPQALNVHNNIVVIGGWGDFDAIDVYDDVQVSAWRADGSLGPWRTSSGRLTTGIYGHAVLEAKTDKAPTQSLLLSLGGQPGTGAYANWISYAYVWPGVALPEAIGTWRIAATGRLPTGRTGIGAAQSHAFVYVIGGNDANGQYYRDVLSAQFDFGRP